jgi:hypothetical protein
MWDESLKIFWYPLLYICRKVKGYGRRAVGKQHNGGERLESADGPEGEAQRGTTRGARGREPAARGPCPVAAVGHGRPFFLISGGPLTQMLHMRLVSQQRARPSSTHVRHRGGPTTIRFDRFLQFRGIISVRFRFGWDSNVCSMIGFVSSRR